MMQVDRILVVCVGNICRSPMAEGLLIKKYPNKTVSSAGLSALEGAPADPFAMQIMGDIGIDISQHVGKQIAEDMVLSADLILTMSQDQCKWIESKWSFARGKTFRLGHWINEDVVDPYQTPKEVFVAVKSVLERGLDAWAEKII